MINSALLHADNKTAEKSGERAQSCLVLRASLFANILLSKADEKLLILYLYVLDQLVTPTPRRLVSKYIERESA